jgi:hypothetical protein
MLGCIPKGIFERSDFFWCSKRFFLQESPLPLPLCPFTFSYDTHYTCADVQDLSTSWDPLFNASYVHAGASAPVPVMANLRTKGAGESISSFILQDVKNRMFLFCVCRQELNIIQREKLSAVKEVREGMNEVSEGLFGEDGASLGSSLVSCIEGVGALVGGGAANQPPHGDTKQEGDLQGEPVFDVVGVHGGENGETDVSFPLGSPLS